LVSDLSKIIRDEIVNTLENLLSTSVNINDVEKLNGDELGDEQCIKIDTSFSLSGSNSSWNFVIPTPTATKFEYLMLGGVTDLKESIDDEITDAVKEIISTICGSITTSVNAQGFADISDVKFDLGDSSVIQCGDSGDQSHIYKFSITLSDETMELYVLFDDVVFPYIEGLSEGGTVLDDVPASPAPLEVQAPVNSVLSTLLGEESVDNLRLLFDIKLRLSVRLGTKVCLLRDVISWDIGEIIELTQMTNEPLDILVNGVVIGQGEAVIVDGKFGVKIKYIGEPKIN
jgi:flagellar motor switch protein FliN/FliY